MTNNLDLAVISESSLPRARVGLACWMHDVLDQCAKVDNGLDPDPVHDLRTSLRRCRSIADGMRVFDSHPAWKKMKHAAKVLFASLGDLRDTHVMAEWVETIAPEHDRAAQLLLAHLDTEQQKFKKIAAATLQQFDRKQWTKWMEELPARAERIPPDSPVLAHYALEKWHHARVLHVRAMRNRSSIAYHDLRIALKRLRYTLENFLPNLHQAWGKDLKALQDALGEVHDLDVLWHMAVSVGALSDPETRAAWQSRICEQKRERLEAYRGKMIGKDSLWWTWRASLPAQHELRRAGLERMRLWAAFLNPNFAHARHVGRLALQFFDGLPVEKRSIRGLQRDVCRDVLEAAALMHDVGCATAKRGHHKVSARRIRKLDPPLGWTAAEIRIAALVARYHRGALPRQTQKNFSALSRSRQQTVQLLAGILRLACACDRDHERRIRRLKVATADPVLSVHAEGYVESTPLAEHLAGARHLLEVALSRPIVIIPLQSAQAASAA